MKHLSLEQRASAASLFTNLRTRSLAIAPVTRKHFQAAARFADQSGLGPRAGDALHVAVVAGLGATLCTLDKRLAEAAVALGVCGTGLMAERLESEADRLVSVERRRSHLISAYVNVLVFFRYFSGA